MSQIQYDPEPDGPSTAQLWWIAIGLSLGPAVSNGLARFAYGLLLPEMQADLGWSYTQAGWINTANAIGYLLGSLLALALVRPLGPVRLFVWGMALTTLALSASALTRDLEWLSLWRIVAGIGGAPVFIAGGAIASAIFVRDRARNALVIAVYFGGGGLGMIATGLILPGFMSWFGAAGWPLAWLLLGLGSFLCFIPSCLAAEAAPVPASGSKGGGRLPILAMAPALAAYFMFGLGYLIYITFLIAWLRAQGAGVPLISATWAVMGLAVMLSPFVWRRVLASARGGRAIALTSLAVGAGILLPLSGLGTPAVIASAILMGGSFFMVPTAVTTFGRKNLPEAAWGASIALFTVVFSVGQIIGPVGAGWLADLTGATDAGLLAAGLILLIGAAIGAIQRPLVTSH